MPLTTTLPSNPPSLNLIFFVNAPYLNKAHFVRGGEGGTPYNGLRLRPKGVPFSGLRYMKGYEVYERVGKSAIWVCERAQRAKK